MGRLNDEDAYRVIREIPLRERLRQVEDWLREHFPTPYPVIVRVERMAQSPDDTEYDGECYRLGNGIRIRLHKWWKGDGSGLSDTEHHHISECLRHEWAHAMTAIPIRMERKLKQGHSHHPDEFWLAYGRVYRKWMDGRGWRRAAGL